MCRHVAGDRAQREEANRKQTQKKPHTKGLLSSAEVAGGSETREKNIGGRHRILFSTTLRLGTTNGRGMNDTLNSSGGEGCVFLLKKRAGKKPRKKRPLPEKSKSCKKKKCDLLQKYQTSIRDKGKKNALTAGRGWGRICHLRKLFRRRKDCLGGGSTENLRKKQSPPWEKGELPTSGKKIGPLTRVLHIRLKKRGGVEKGAHPALKPAHSSSKSAKSAGTERGIHRRFSWR